MHDLGKCAREASKTVASADTKTKNLALTSIADAITDSADILTSANKEDLQQASTTGLSDALLDRLELTPARIEGMANGLRQIALLPDPIGELSGMKSQPSGLQIGKMRVPLGVIGIIYESRPNVTADAAALCLKAGNATILRGGSEAAKSNQAIAKCIAHGLDASGLPSNAVQVVETTDRQAVGELIQMQVLCNVSVMTRACRLLSTWKGCVICMSINLLI